MDNMALMNQLFHPNPMEVEEEVSPTARLHRQPVHPRQWPLSSLGSLAGLGHDHSIWEVGHPQVWYPEGLQETLVEPCHGPLGQ